MSELSALSINLIKKAKIAYSLRNVPLSRACSLLSGEDVKPRAGDLVLARVNRVGHHNGIELTSGRRATIYAGDLVLVCFGNRYAPDQFEAEVPGHLHPCHLVAAGGMAGQVLSSYSAMKKPTEIVPLGLLADSTGRIMNLAEWRLEKIDYVGPRPLTIAAVGTAMNSGKTTAATNLIKGLVAGGRKVGAAKVTGTGAGKDVWLMADAGASPTYDFTDMGHVSTFRVSMDQVEEILTIITSHLACAGVEVIVLEVADGVYQSETAALLGSSVFKAQVDHILFAARDSAGAVAGVAAIRTHGHHVLAVSGVITNSPLAASEAARMTGLPVVHTGSLCRPEICQQLLNGRDAGLQQEMAVEA